MMDHQVKATGLSRSVLTTVSTQNHRESPSIEKGCTTTQGIGRIQDPPSQAHFANGNDLAARRMCNTALCTHIHPCQNAPYPLKDRKHKAINK